MRDFFHETLDNNELHEMSMLALAHIGDAVFELMVRAHLCKSGLRRARELHRETVLSVSALAQETAARKLIPVLTEDEHDVFMRGRNAKVKTIPKSASPETYHVATALEALFGYTYLKGRYDRLNELFAITISE